MIRREYQRIWAIAFRQRKPEFTMFHNAKRRAKQKGLDFDISIEDISIPNTCPALGIKLDRLTRNSAPSLDRVDNSKGYTKDNIRVISNRANQLKDNASLIELKGIIKYIESHNASCG